MTDLSTEAVAVEAAPAPPSPPPESQTAAAKDGKEVEHTPGGWPVVPLVLTGTNSTVGAVAAASLAGGPVAALAAATGVAVLGAVTAARSRKPNSRRDARRTAARAAGRSAARNAGLRQGRTGTGMSAGAGRGGRSAGSGAGRTGGRPGSRLRQQRRGHGNGTAAHRSGAVNLSKNGTAGRGALKRAPSGTAGKGAAGRAGQIKALRAAQHAADGTRADRREQTTAARRAVADARRDARAASRASRAAGGQGAARRAAGWAAGRAASGSRALVNRARAARDRRTNAQVEAKRDQVRKAPARRRARWGLLKSAARFQGRRLLAAVLGGAVGVLGYLTTPLGRKLGWKWLMHPGRRLYRRLMQTAREQRAVRDEQIRERLRAEETTTDTDAIGDRVERPASTVPTAPTADQEIHVSGFKFEEAAAEMENAARSYEPDGNMEVLAMIDNLPTALLSVANTFRILAERSDEEFAFEKDVAAGFDDIHRTLLNAVDAAETLVPLFRGVHAADIARHEDPRNGPEAEKGWNV
ncbi:hypothetical protein ABZ800_15420 [Streptomyces sp. NPDC047813]|uniref:hypothetical protein n=1 Tax=Streptomyces sp. NPDC047813 TaxID=3154608 RepID=UPI0033D0EDF8